MELLTKSRRRMSLYDTFIHIPIVCQFLSLYEIGVNDRGDVKANQRHCRFCRSLFFGMVQRFDVEKNKDRE